MTIVGQIGEIVFLPDFKFNYAIYIDYLHFRFKSRIRKTKEMEPQVSVPSGEYPQCSEESY